MGVSFSDQRCPLWSRTTNDVFKHTELNESLFIVIVEHRRVCVLSNDVLTLQIEWGAGYATAGALA